MISQFLDRNQCLKSQIGSKLRRKEDSMRTELVLAIVILVQFVEAHNFNMNTDFAFPSFTRADDSNKLIQVVSDASYNADFSSYDLNVLGNMSSRLAYTSCGRILWRDALRVRAGTQVASFSTSFTFTFDVLDLATDPSYCGDGIAFAFFRSNNFTEAEYERRGGGLCLLDFYDTSPANRVFAVEFDSYKNWNYSDPSDSHIGVDVNSTSLKTFDLCTSEFLGLRDNSLNQSCNFYCGVGKGQDFTAWIDYDSVAATLGVRFVVGEAEKPTDPVITVKNLTLQGVLDEDMFVGLTGSTGRSRRIHRIKAWNFTSSGLVISVAENRNTKALIRGALVATGVVAILAGLLLFFWWSRWRVKRSLENHELQLRLAETSRAFTFKELSRTTKNFSESERLSSGAFGDVYKGTLPSGTLVAVKRIKANKECGEESFLAEATSLRQIRHRNLLQLRGWSHSKEGLLLVYDYMCNGSLDKWLHPQGEFAPLSWKVRRFILTGVASSLVYLHEEWVQCVLHRDIKSSNVMLDADFNPYLGDFGLARFVDHHKLEKTTLLAGTLGYMAPEMIHTGRATKETDVYAFGILVLEVATGRRPLNPAPSDHEYSFVLIDSVWHAHETGHLIEVADPWFLRNDQSVAMADVSFQSHALQAQRTAIERVLQVGLLCCLPNPSERPSMREVNQWFQANENATMEAMPSLPSAQPKFSPRLSSASARNSSPVSSSYQASFSSTRSSPRLVPR